jgi:hypothetical protein
VYPVQAANGSTIIVYGHEQGIRVVWRGGKSFKPKPESKEKPKVNGSSREDAMVLDSDDEETTPARRSSTTDFEAEEEERDFSEPYHRIIRQIDINCGTGVRHVAVPQIPSDISDVPPGAYPPILSSHVVVAAACNDCSIRVFSLPLEPPIPSIEDSSYNAVQQLRIAGINAHNDVPSSIAITHSALLEERDDLRDRSKSRSRSRSRVFESDGAIGGNIHASGKAWCFLLVSVSTRAGGLLLTHQIPLVSETQLSNSADDLPPIQRQHLRCPCSSSTVVFNPAAYPADRHSTVVLSTAGSGNVKIYQVTPDRRWNASRGRRNSTATTDSGNSGVRASQGVASHNGKFLITLYPPFIRSQDPAGLTRRKHILDVTWIAFGRAIFVLLEDGEWGIWDLEGTGPTSGPANLLQGQNTRSGIQGGALTGFAISGSVAPQSEALRKAQKPEQRQTRDTKLAPMTPHTRKVRSEGLFRGKESTLETLSSNDQLARGYVCATEHPPATNSALSASEESLVIAHGSNLVYIHSLQALWRAQTSSKGTFDPMEAVRPSPLTTLGLGSERIVGMGELPRTPSAETSSSAGPRHNKGPGVVVATEHRLIFFATPLTDSSSAEKAQTRLFLPAYKAQVPPIGAFSDQALLGQGELDLDGMDRILDGMGAKRGTTNGQGTSIGKGVAFNLGQDEDVSMASPTPKAGGKSRRTPGRSLGRSNGSAFS